jgi:hypothetical protein
MLECRRELHEFAAPSSEPASSREFAELAGDLAVMAAADKRDGWRVNSMQFIGVFVWHMLGMPESDYPIVKARLKCWLIAGRCSAAKPRLLISYRTQARRSHWSLALASRIVCHWRFDTASGPPQASAFM